MIGPYATGFESYLLVLSGPDIYLVKNKIFSSYCAFSLHKVYLVAFSYNS